MKLVNQYLTNEQEKSIIKSLLQSVPNDGIGKAKRRLLNEKSSFEVFPGIYRDSIQYKSFMRALYEEAKDLFSGHIDTSTGLYNLYPATTDEASRLRYLPGLGRPVLNFGRDRNNIVMTDEFRKHVKNVVSVLLGKHNGKIGKITRNSLSGFPYFLNDHTKKLGHLDVVSQNLDIFCRLYECRDMEGLNNKLGVSFVSNTQIRLQTDAFVNGKPKERKVEDFRCAYFEEKPMRLDSSDMYDEFFGRCRTRVVCAMPGLVNNMMSCIFEGFKSFMFDEFSDTFKHRGIDDIKRKIGRYRHVIGSDIVSFDNKAPENLINEIIKCLPVTELAKSIITDMLYGPFFCGDADGKGSMHISEDWRNKEYSTWKGMPSGIFCTTVINCIEVVVIKTWEFSRFYPELLTSTGLIRWLKHELPIASLIMSDDNQDLFNNEEIYSYYKDQNGYSNMLIPVELEQGVSFLGIRSYIDECGNIDYCQSPVTYLVNQYIPEKPAGSFYRPYPVLGLQLREDVFKTMPKFDVMKEVENRLWHDILGINRERYIVDGAKKDSLVLFTKEMSSKITIDNLTDIDREVLNDPTKVYYKYDESDVNPVVLQMISERIPIEIFDRFAKILL